MRRGLLLGALLLGGCATITEGTTQDITVDVVPDTGYCTLTREGEEIGVSSPGHRVVNIHKSRKDITFACTAPGYQDATETLSSDLSAATVASILLLDFGIVDAVSGASRKYPKKITVVMKALPENAPASKRR